MQGTKGGASQREVKRTPSLMLLFEEMPIELDIVVMLLLYKSRCPNWWR